MKAMTIVLFCVAFVAGIAGAYMLGVRRGRASVPPWVDLQADGFARKSFSLHPGDSITFGGFADGIDRKLTATQVGITGIDNTLPEERARVERARREWMR